MIDVHILVRDEPKELLDRCVASMDGQPVTLHIINGYNEWPPYKGRSIGFSRGKHPFVASVDPDDWVEPRAFDDLLEAIDGYDVAYGWEYQHWPDGTVRLHKHPHHAYVMRRGLNINYGREWCELYKLPDKVIHIVKRPLYNWVVGERYGRGR